MDLMEKDGNMQEQMGNINGETGIVRAKKNSSNKKHCNKNKGCLWWAHEHIPVKKRVSTLKNTAIEASKTQMQGCKDMKMLKLGIEEKQDSHTGQHV